MRIEILGTESLGVRGLCCVVHTADRRILIDTGIALGYRRAGLLPHPVQIAAGEDVRRHIVRCLKTATDVVISHLHGDHMPLADANPFQLPLGTVAGLLQGPRLWIRAADDVPPSIADRRHRLLAAAKKSPTPCEGRAHGPLQFSHPAAHGAAGSPLGSVMMTRVTDGTDVFVHGADIQLLDDEPVQQILAWRPTILLVSGPPVYRHLSDETRTLARRRALKLAEAIRCCVIDHHLLRSEDGIRWLDGLSGETRGRIVCAADFMGRNRRFLEAQRARWYEKYPVPDGWHDRYARREETTDPFRFASTPL